MTRILITGGPRTGKTTLAQQLRDDALQAQISALGPGAALAVCDEHLTPIRHTDDLIAELAHLGKDAWSEGSRRVAEWLDAPGPWIIEGVSLARALRKWREAHPGERPPVDRVIRLTTPHVELTKGQAAMAKGEETVWQEIAGWIGPFLCESPSEAA